MTLTSGMRLGPYEITALLGSGGMGHVYRARDVRLGREVAIKIVPEDLSANPDALARFEREARTASALNHPHLVTIYDIGEAPAGDSRVHYMAMELIEGQPLRHHLFTAPRDVLLRYIADVADGLAKAHDAGVIHRDLKPENVMVSVDHFAKVVDFGLAKHLPRLDGAMEEHLTAEGFCVGTLGYMAPEQVRGHRDIDARADIFALGCILYEAIAKENPFDGDSAIDTMHHILYTEPPPLPDADVDRIVRKCLAKDRGQRYASMRELAADIRTAIATPPQVVTQTTRWTVLRSLAALPFHNVSSNEELQFLSDGIPEDVVRNLGRVPGLRVIASSSTLRFRNVTDPQRVARELNVDAVVVGQLREIAGKVVLHAELVKADGTAAWSKRYARELTDVVQLEQEIAGDLCDELRLELGPQQKPAARPEAYDEYLRGKLEVAKETAPAFTKGIEHFGRAIDLDPEWALPYAALAQVYGRRALLGIAATFDTILQLRALGNKALSLDDSVPEAHYNLAIAARLVWDTPEFERHIGRALALNPNFAQAWAERASVYAFDGRFDEAEAAFQQARTLDPLAPRVMTAYAASLAVMRQFDRALTILRNATTQFPHFPIAYAYLAILSCVMGKHADALAAIERSPADTMPNVMIWKGFILTRVGRVAEARAIADRVDEIAMTRYLSTYYRAQLRAELGDRDVAFALMEEGIREGDWYYGMLSVDAGFDSLRDDPRYRELLQKLPR